MLFGMGGTSIGDPLAVEVLKGNQSQAAICRDSNGWLVFVLGGGTYFRVVLKGNPKVNRRANLGNEPLILGTKHPELPSAAGSGAGRRVQRCEREEHFRRRCQGFADRSAMEEMRHGRSKLAPYVQWGKSRVV